MRRVHDRTLVSMFHAKHIKGMHCSIVVVPREITRVKMKLQCYSMSVKINQLLNIHAPEVLYKGKKIEWDIT